MLSSYYYVNAIALKFRSEGTLDEFEEVNDIFTANAVNEPGGSIVYSTSEKLLGLSEILMGDTGVTGPTHGRASKF